MEHSAVDTMTQSFIGCFVNVLLEAVSVPTFPFSEGGHATSGNLLNVLCKARSLTGRMFAEHTSDSSTNYDSFFN